MRSSALALRVLALSALSACQSHQYYAGSALPPAQTAEVYVSTAEALPVTVGSINGKNEHFPYSKRLYMLPGEVQFGFWTGAYTRLDLKDGARYGGRFNLSLVLKPGKTYVFRSTQKAQGYMTEDSKLCAYEEDQDSPKARKSVLNEFRQPAEDAVQLACAPVEVFKYPTPAATPASSAR